MDKLPENFSRKVKRMFNPDFPDWEDLTTKEAVGADFMIFSSIIEEQGIKLDDKTPILEIGSGNGMFIDYAKKKGIKIIGVDVKHRTENKELKVGARIEQLPFADESFEVVVSRGIFNGMLYRQFPDLMMEEIARVLKSGGVYIGSDEEDLPNPDGLDFLEEGFGRKVYRKK